jgi:hypothetical protein
LDGERNLKPKMPIKKAEAQIDSYFAGSGYDFFVHSEGPNANLYAYEGNLEATKG